MSTSTTETGIEIHPGPRGHSVVSANVTPDGRAVRFTTDEPRVLNPVPLPVGPRGDEGPQGVPGRSAVRVDRSAGYRVYQWDPTLAAETMVYGDTGVLHLTTGQRVRRVMGVVELEGTVEGLPAGFTPAMAQPGTTHKLYTTSDPWPDPLPAHTLLAAPVEHTGLGAYDADRAGGYPGTPEQWLADSYRVVLPPAGEAGQVLTRTPTGAGWADPTDYGPGPWVAITLDKWAPINGSGAFCRVSAGTVELYGQWRYTGPTTTVGSYEYLRVGVLPPAYAPAHGVDVPVNTYREFSTPAPGGQTASLARLVISTQGVMSLAAISVGNAPGSFPAKTGVAEVNVSAVSYAQRNSSPMP